MRRRLILHIGMPKTGSSYLQAFLAQNVGVLAGHGIDYPNLVPLDSAIAGVVTSGNAVRFAAALLPPEHPSALKPAAAETEWVKLRDVLAAAKLPTVLLSSEFFWPVPAEGFARLRSAAAEAGFDCGVIVFLRRQDEFLQSHYAQLVSGRRRPKGGRPRESAEEFCTRMLMESERGGYFYSRRLRPLADLFGPQSIIVRPFEKSQFVGGNLAFDFLAALGLEQAADFTTPQQQSLNDGPSALELKTLLLLKAVGLRFRYRSRLAALARRLGGAGYAANLLSPELKARILEVYAADNRLVAEHFLGRSDGRLFLSGEP
jgi:hypothetical protein